jgi:ParB family transcriptional regulator, chromosome partitioning protein
MSVPPSRASRPKRFAVVADLLKDTSSRGAGVEEMMNAKQIRRDRIVPDPDQPRKSFPQESLEELATSLKARGMLEPISVRYDRPNDRYIIISGERRWRASGIAGLEMLPAIVREDQEAGERLIDQLMENLQREDLNDIDRADGLNRLKEAMGGVAWERVAEAVGIGRTRLFQLLDLLDERKTPEPERQAVRKGELTEKHIRVLRRVSGPLREGLRRVMIEDRMSAKEADMAADALVQNPSMSIQTTPEQVAAAVRRIRIEAKTPREPEPRMNLRGLLPAGQELPTIDAAAIKDVQQSAERLLRYLLAMSTEPGDPEQARRLRPLIRRLRDTADLYLDSVKE